MIQSYLTVICYFVYNYILKNVVLDSLPIDHSHSVENLSRSLKETLDNFNITKEKVICLTTDNATNTLGIAKRLEFLQIGCYVHKWNLVVTDSLFSTQKSKEKFSVIFVPLEPLYNATESVKKIVTYFHPSIVAMSALKSELKINDICNNSFFENLLDYVGLTIF